MRRVLVLVLVFIVALSFVNAGLFDWFRVQESIKITGNVLDGPSVGDCVSCIDSLGGFWCIDDQQCNSWSCEQQIFDSHLCIGGDEEEPPLGCEDTCSSLGYDCGFPLICEESSYCGHCSLSNYEVCTSYRCLVDCSYYERTLNFCSEDESVNSVLCSRFDSTCCLSSNYCVYEDVCYSSGSTYYEDYCYQGTWYGSLFDATCGNGVCDAGSGENYENCPGDNCPGECIYDSECSDQVCKTKSCEDYFCEYSNVVNGASCSGGFCTGGSCNAPTCSIDSECNDGDDYTVNICENKGQYNSYCNNTEITWCESEDLVCPSDYGCTWENDEDCGICNNDGNQDFGETCANCENDVSCDANQKCSSGVCVLSLISYDFSTSSDVVFSDLAEETEIKDVVKEILTEAGNTFTVDVLQTLPLGYIVPSGRKIIKILNITSSNPDVNASLELEIAEDLFNSSIEDVKVHVEGSGNDWEILDSTGIPGFTGGVYDVGVYTEHFSIFLITEPEGLCGNGKFDSSEEECDGSVSGVDDCLSCLCKAGFEPDGEGSCFEDFGGQGCSISGEEKCTGYSFYNCSDSNLWKNNGNVVGKCGVDCFYGDTGCEGEIPKKCDATYKWDLQAKVSGVCGYQSTRTPEIEETYEEEEEDPCEDGDCVSNDRENSLEEKNPSWLGWFIAGLIVLIVVVAFTLLKIHNRLENE